MTTEVNNFSDDNIKKSFLYEELSYKIIGSYGREKQYSELFKEKFIKINIPYKRELRIGDSGNILDFVIDEKIILEFKTVPYLILEHYDQVKRYLHQTGLKLGIW